VTLFDPLQKYLGVDINHDRANRTVQCNQATYIDSIQTDFEYRVENIPVCPSYNLRLAQSNVKNESLLPITGKLRHVVDRSRPDCLFATGEMSTGNVQHPSDLHVNTAMKTINYIKSTAKEYLTLGGGGELELFGFCDASYITTGDCKSRMGGCIFLGKESGAFYSYSKLSPLIAQSSMHAEVQSLDEILRIIIHVRDVMKFLRMEMKRATKVYLDNKSAKEMCETLKATYRTSAINMRIHFIRECINNRIISLHFVGTELNVADILTKALNEETFNRHKEPLLHGFNGKLDF
jgi:hypothetical protein